MALSLELAMVIYVITHVASGRQYVGQTVRIGLIRKEEHFSSASKLKNEMYISRAIRKHGINAFTFEVIEQCDSQVELDECEAFWIKKLNTLSPNGFNLRAGARSHGAMAQEVCDRISVTMTGREFTEEHCENIRRARIGKRHTEETCLKISANRKGKGSTRGRPSPRRGVPLTDAHRESIKLGLANGGREKMSMAQKKRRQRERELRELITKKGTQNTNSSF